MRVLRSSKTPSMGTSRSVAANSISTPSSEVHQPSSRTPYASGRTAFSPTPSSIGSPQERTSLVKARPREQRTTQISDQHKRKQNTSQPERRSLRQSSGHLRRSPFFRQH